MPYCTMDDLKTKIDERALTELTDTAGLNVPDASKVDRAIRDASALVDSYLGKAYRVPFNPIPHTVIDITSALAIGNLHRFRSAESPVWKAACDDAMTRLRAIARGEASLEGAIAEPPASDDDSAALMFTSSARRFSRDSLNGM
ncbi:MAG: DUF1320 domain-containing protein [Nitrospinae bacterium]|nr:DUF1320 domain-containing protein [Nitrospinota bacterium]